jgi:hypothetical protein
MWRLKRRTEASSGLAVQPSQERMSSMRMGIQMIKNRKAPTGFKDAGASSVPAERCCAAYATNSSRFRSVQKNVPCSS